MINLLPPEQRTAVGREYKFRLASAYILLLSVALFVGTALLLPTYFFVNVREQVTLDEFAAIQSSSEIAEQEEIRAELLQTKGYLQRLTQERNQMPVYTILEMVSLHADTDIEIENLIYSHRSGEEQSELAIGGVALTRDALLRFKRGLESEEMFEEIVLPVSSLAKDEDIAFNIQAKGMF